MSDETKTTIGVIEDKQTKEGKTNDKDWKRFMFKIGGEMMSTFDTNNDEFKVGDTVDVEYTVSGNYKNIQTMKGSTKLPPTTAADPIPPAPVATSAPAKMPSYSERNKETECSIVSQVIIKACADMISAGKIDPGSIKANAEILAEVYKKTKETLLKENEK